METAKIQLLLAEDQYVEMYQALLARHNGFEFTNVKRGEHAVKEIRQGDFDVVWMDIRLPGRMNGIEAIRQIRKFNKTIPIIAITAYSDKTSRKKALEAGANAYFKKPPNYGKLYRRIIELLAERPIVGRATKEKKFKRLHILREQQALRGFDTPPHVLIEIEELEQELGLTNPGGR